MHYYNSAKRGMAIACRPSVCPSVRNVGGSGSHTLEISETNCTRSSSPTPSLFVAQRTSTYSEGNMGKLWGDYRGGVGKNGVLEHKIGNISEMRKDIGKVTIGSP